MDMFFLVQAIFGSVLSLFLPGYAWARLLFKNRELDPAETFALSVVLSMAMLSLAVLYLNKFLGVPINTVNICLTALVLTAVPALASCRKVLQGKRLFRAGLSNQQKV